MPPLAPGFGEMSPKTLMRLLQREFGYVVVRGAGSHQRLKSPTHPPITLAIHAKGLGPALVRSILVKQVGLTLEEAQEVVKRA